MKNFFICDSFVFSRKFFKDFFVLLLLFFLSFKVFAEDVYYRWTPYTDSSWDGVWSETNNDSSTDTETRSEANFWSYWNDSKKIWEKTYNKSGGTADYPGSNALKTAYTYFTGEHSVEAKLDSTLPYPLEVLYIGDCYKESSSFVGSKKVTINLASFELKTKNLVLGNSSLGTGDSVNFALSGGGTLIVSEKMTFAAGCTYNIDIGENTVLDVSDLTANVFGTTINFSGEGTLKLGTATFTDVSSVSFAGELKNSGKLNFSACPTVEFAGGLTNSGNLEFSGNVESSVSGKITNSGTLTLNQTAKTTFSVGVENQTSGILLCNETSETTFSGEFVNSGKVTINGGAVRTFANFENQQNGTFELFGNASSSVSFLASFTNEGMIYSSGLCTVAFTQDVKDSGTWIYSGGTVKNQGISYNILELTGSVVISGDLTAEEIKIKTAKLNIQGKLNSDLIEINTDKTIVLDGNATIHATSVNLLQDTTFDVNGKNLAFGSENDGSSIISDGKKNLVILDSASGGKTVFYSSLGTATSPLGQISSEPEISFNSDVCSDSIETKSAAQISSAKITTTNGQNYNSAVSVTGTQAEFISENDGISFVSVVEISAETAISALNGSVQFFSNITVTGSGSIYLMADTIFSGDSTISLENGNFSVGNESNQKTVTVENGSAVEFQKVAETTFSGDFINSGKVTINGGATLSFSSFENKQNGVISVNETSNVVFAKFINNDASKFSVNDSAKINFQTGFTNSASGTVELFGEDSSSINFPADFKNSGTICSSGLCSVNFASPVTDSGTWIYSGGTVKNEGISYNILELNGTVSILGDLTATKIKIETENLKIQGEIKSGSIEINTKNKIVLGENATIDVTSASLLRDTTFDVNGKNLVFGAENQKSSIISGGKKNLVILDSASGGKTVFYSSLGTATSPLGQISSEPEISFNSDVCSDSIETKSAAQISSTKITTTNGQSYKSSVSVTGTQAEFVSRNGGISFGGTVDISTENTISASGSSSGFSVKAENVQFDSDFVSSGSVLLLADVYFSGAAKDEIKITAEKIVVGSEDIEKNLYISAVKDENAAKKVELSAPISVYGSLLLLNGGLSLGKNPFGVSPDISAGKDIVLLNGDSSSMYDDEISDKFYWRSGAKNIFKYQGAAVFPEKFSDGTEISSEKFISSLSGLGGNTISAGQNFYCNGVNLEGGSTWNLKAGDNDNSENFAVAYNSSIKNCAYSSSGSGISYFATAEATDSGGNNENVCFGHPEIDFARTIYDDVVEISFKDSVSGKPVKIENSNNEIWGTFASSSKFLTYENDGEKISFAGTYIDAECTETTKNQGDLEKIYLKAPETWNTDATGKSSGAEQSTDMSGNHREAIPYLNIVRAVSDDFSGLLDEHKNRVANYDGEKRFDDVMDSCPPVLIAVRTGQELHEELPENQMPYDSHNFLEFQYSEEINILDGKIASSALNVQSSENFGGMENNSSGSGFVVAGLVQFEKGKITLGSESGVAPEKLNSFYRNFAVSASDAVSPQNQTHRFRIALVGYQSQSAAENPSGFPYWPGYIDSEKTEIPAGEIIQLSAGGTDNENGVASDFNDFIKDSEGNSLLVKSKENHKLKTLSVISESAADSLEPDWNNSVYGSWDLSAPVFALYHSLRSNARQIYETCEILGACESSDTVLNRVEFHVFDNSEEFFSDLGAEWYSHFGWGKNKSTLFTEDSYASDIFGGARPFGNSSGDSAKTSGGMRYSTLYNKSSYFRYGIDYGSPAEEFKDSTIKSGASSSLFLSQNRKPREISSNDSLYFSIFLKDGTNLPLKTNFSIKFDEKACVTDLAGNLMKSATVKSVDLVPPRFNMTSAKISGNKLYVVFNKKLSLEPVELENSDGATDSFEIADSLRFIKIPETPHEFNATEDVVSDLFIEKEIPPQETYSSDTFTGLIFTLNRNVTLEDVKNYYIQCYSPGIGKFVDPFTGIPDVKVTSVTDINGIYMMHGEAHALSDFAVNAVNPVYAYDDRFLDKNFGFSASDVKLSNLSVHDWNKEQQNDGTLVTEHDIFVVTSQDSGNSGSDETLPEKIIMYYDNEPELDSVSSEYNKNLEENIRVWIPSFVPCGEDSNSSMEKVSPFLALAPSTNSRNLFVSGEIDKSVAKFAIDWETLSKTGYSSGNQVSFLFGLADSDGSATKICHAPVYDEISGIYKLEKQPLFALRLKNSDNPASLDLWSFKLKDVALQRGNVTIFNNVIDANQGEMSVVRVNMPSEGKLDVIVMTLDGNVIRYLQHGTASAGEHNYSWNGTTKSGKKVARGLYFVRVFGNGIDETRKIMVVKN